MHITIINASPYGNRYSNTKIIVNAFESAVTESGNEVTVYSLYDRTQWDSAIKSVLINENIVFAMPVYAVITPSIFKEFLEQLDCLLTEDVRRLHMSFILQGSFPESSQRACCEKYLKSIPEHLNCNFSGILSHSIFYGFIENEQFGGLSEAYSYFGKRYVENNFTFFFPEAADFNGAEYLTEKQAKKFARGFNFMCKHIAEEKGLVKDLCDRSLEDL